MYLNLHFNHSKKRNQHELLCLSDMITNVDIEQQEANSLDECIDQAMGYCNEANTLRTTVRNQTNLTRNKRLKTLDQWSSCV